MTDLFDYEPSAQQLADAGMAQAVEHADAEAEGWSDQAFALFTRYARLHPLFMTEDVRTWAHREGLDLPPDGRAWGAITNRAVRRGMVVCDHYRKTSIPPAHATPRPVWRSRIYEGSTL